jgi:hypothetical protein
MGRCPTYQGYVEDVRTLKANLREIQGEAARHYATCPNCARRWFSPSRVPWRAAFDIIQAEDRPCAFSIGDFVSDPEGATNFIVIAGAERREAP